MVKAIVLRQAVKEILRDFHLTLCFNLLKKRPKLLVSHFCDTIYEIFEGDQVSFNGRNKTKRADKDFGKI